MAPAEIRLVTPVAPVPGSFGASNGLTPELTTLVPVLSGPSLSAPKLNFPSPLPTAAVPATLAPQSVRPAKTALAGLKSELNTPKPDASDLTVSREHASRSFETKLGETTSLESDSRTDATVAAVASNATRLKPAPLKTSPLEQKTLDKVTKELGPILDRKDAPVLYSALGTVFDRLSAAQKKLFPTDAVSINHIHIIDTPMLNAFVYPLKTPGVRRSSNLVFITTGLLKKMLDKDPDLLKNGIIRVAGTLAHELAHPLDNMDGEGILTNYGKDMGSQAREIRADSEGAMITKEAGYPVDGVYEFLKRLFAGEESGGTAQSLASTHPQNDLRLTMQRMLLTMNRYDKGSHASSFPDDVPAGLLNELAGIDKGGVLGRFAPLSSLSDARARLEKVIDEKRDDPHRVLEFNRLVLAIDSMLAKKGELSDADFSSFTDISKLMARGGAPDILDRDGMAKLFTKENHSTELLAFPSHERFMKKIAAFNNSRYLDWVKANYYTKQAEGYGSVGKTLDALIKILPSEHIFALFGDRIAKDLPGEMRAHSNIRYTYDPSITKDKSIEFKVRLAVLFHRRILPGLTAEERLAFFVESTSDEYSYVFPQTHNGEARNYSLGILKQPGLLMGDPRLKSLQADYRAAMQSIWDQRGYYGTMDLIVQFNTTDWDSLFAVLGIDSHVGRGQLRQAVKAFTKTPAYAQALRTSRESNLESFRNHKLGHAMGKHDNITWLDDTMGPYLAGDFNDALRADPALWTPARQLFAGAFYGSRPKVFRRNYERRFTSALAASPAGLTLTQVEELHRGLMDALVGTTRGSISLIDIQAETIDRSAWPAETKRQILRSLFLEGYPDAKNTAGLTFDSAGDWLPQDVESKPVIRILIKNKVIRSTQDLLSQLLIQDDFVKLARNDSFSTYSSIVSRLKTELTADLDASLAEAKTDSEKAAVLLRFLETAADPGNGQYHVAATVNTPQLRELKTKAATLASGLNIPLADHLHLFRRLTGTAATPSTDAYFQKKIEPVFDEAAAEAAGLGLTTILDQGRIAGTSLQLTLTRRLLEPEVERMTAAPQDPEALNRLIETINAYVRQGSLRKDEYLESLAWRLELKGPELGAFIEDEKSYNWRKANPMLLRFGSALSSEISKFSPSARRDFIRFLIEPEGRELPAVILKELRGNLFNAALAADKAKKYHNSPATIKKDSERAADLMKLKIEAALIDASPFERIPLFELLLSAGDNALQQAADFPYNVARDFLKYEKDSKEEKMLAAYLTVVPAHERTVSLAYLLSQAGDNKSSVNHLFEVFQTVGVKFGQMSSTWKLFGEEIARQTSTLKNAARPMTKAEILEAAQQELTPQEFARIKRLVKIIGSASLKTVVLVELTDGREVVMLLRRPHAAEQIESNLALGKDFLRELDRRGMTAASALFNAVLDAVRGQLTVELKMTREAYQLLAAKEFYNGLNRSMSAQLKGWRFEVPALVPGFELRDTLMFMEKAQGTTYDKLSPSDRAQAGPLIVESSLRLLFRKGWFDADRHTGNQLIDADRKVIYPLDFGQATLFSKTAFWKTDDRYEFSQFLRALGAGDAASLLSHGQAMSSQGPTKDMTALRLKIEQTLTGDGSMADQLVSLVTAFADHSLPLDGKFTFGAFKSLMTLYGESYALEEDFRRVLGREISRLLVKKFPQTIFDGRAQSQPGPRRLRTV